MKWPDPKVPKSWYSDHSTGREACIILDAGRVQVSTEWYRTEGGQMFLCERGLDGG